MPGASPLPILLFFGKGCGRATGKLIQSFCPSDADPLRIGGKSVYGFKDGNINGLDMLEAEDGVAHGIGKMLDEIEFVARPNL